MSLAIAEKSLLKPVKRYLRDHGCMRLLPELRFFDRGIDLYGFADEGERTYAVELKITDWQKALRQAAIYQLCADFSYVAMPAPQAARVRLEGFHSAGVGLLGVHIATNTVIEILPAKASAVKHQLYSRSFKHSFGSSEGSKANAKRSA